MLKTKSGQETIKAIPADRLLLETDAPFTIRIKSINVVKKELNTLVNVINEIRDEDVSRLIVNNSMRIWHEKT